MRLRRHPKGYECETASLGGLPSVLSAEDYGFSTAYAFLLRDDHAHYESDALVTVIAGIVHRYLQRGSSAPPTPDLEEAIYRRVGLDSVLKKQPNNSEEFGYRPFEGKRPNPRELRMALAMAHGKARPVLDPLLRHDGQTIDHAESARFDSEEEGNFLDWALKSTIGNYAKYFLPQVEFADLGSNPSDARRVDFLYCDGANEPFVVEIDGVQHDHDVAVDQARDAALGSFGLEVKRLPASALNAGESGEEDPALQVFRAWLQGRLKSTPNALDVRWVDATRLIQDAAALQFALTRLWAKGMLRPAGTAIVLTGDLPEDIAQAALTDWKALISAILGAHGFENGHEGPAKVELAMGTGSRTAYHIALESGQPWWHEISTDTQPDLIVRRCALPKPMLSPTHADPEWWQWKRSAQDAKVGVRARALQWILQATFRKANFREGQREAIIRCLDGKDTVVLLATGAGKSLIYRLPAILSPGTALVVAPLVALIEDQKEGFASAGIRQVIGLYGGQPEEMEQRARRRLEDGTLLVLMMSPERLQKSDWRTPVQSAAEAGAISLAVVDEAHCVSEWGHDFRPVYSQLGRLLRDVFQIRAVLALTGTASRSVYKDMVAHLEMARDDPQACIRPVTHDRPEIEMSLRYCTSKADAAAARSGAFRLLKRKFQGNPTTVFSPNGSRSRCGIVFMPTVNNPDNGIESGARLVEAAGLRFIAKHGGQEPYLKDRRTNARQFKRNEATVMVATSGYGMGVDKPNVRWIVHPHLVSSLEAYYQQIGRAGRDRDKAYAVAVLHDEQPKNTDDVLDPDKTFDQAKRMHQQRWDDVGTALFFHFGQFKGPRAEQESLIEVVHSLNVTQPAGERRVSLKGRTLERDIGRLMRLGIVEYYQVDYGSKRVIAHVGEWEPEQIVESLREYVSRFDRVRGNAVSDELKETLAQADRLEALEMGCQLLVDYLYETVEPARRRALRETVLMARQCRTDAEIRRWMLDYLSEGKGTEKIKELLDCTSIDWDAWHSIFGDVVSEGPIEAGRVRGLFIRALESNPGHPALLLGRAISEVAAQDGVMAVVEENLRAAFGALSRYARGAELGMAFEGVCRWLERADEDGLGPLCGISLVSTHGRSDFELEGRLRERASQWRGRKKVDQILRIEAMETVAEDLEGLSGRLTDFHGRIVRSEGASTGRVRWKR